MNVKIGAIIKKLRAENRITQDTLATAMGVTPQAISRWESEGGYPDIELLPALADFFSVSIDELWDTDRRKGSRSWNALPRSALLTSALPMPATPLPVFPMTM